MNPGDLTNLPAGSLEPALRASIEIAQRRNTERLRIVMDECIDRLGLMRNFNAAPQVPVPARAGDGLTPVSSPAVAAPFRNLSDARRSALCETIRLRCAESMDPIATAIISPSIASDYLSDAIRSLQAALEAADELDPPQERA